MTEELAVYGNAEVTALSSGVTVEPLTEQENQLVQWLLKRNMKDRVEVTIPSDIDDQKLFEYIQSCLKVAASLNSARLHLHPVIGRLLNLMADRPDVVKMFGVTSMEQFIKQVVEKKFGVHRSEAMNARNVVKMFPEISSKEYVEAGAQKLKAIGRVVDWNPDDPNIHIYKKYAEDHNYDELVRYMEGEGEDVSDVEIRTYVVKVAKSDLERIREFMRDPKIHAYCGSDVERVILMRMFGECAATWYAEEYAREANERPF